MARQDPAVVIVPSASATGSSATAARSVTLPADDPEVELSKAPSPPWISSAWVTRQRPLQVIGTGSAAYAFPAPYKGPVTTSLATFGDTDVPPPTERERIRAGAPAATLAVARYPCPPGTTPGSSRFNDDWVSFTCTDKDYRRQGRATTFYKTRFVRYDFFVDDQMRKFVWLLPGHATCVRWFDELGHALETRVYADDGGIDAAGVCAP